MHVRALLADDRPSSSATASRVPPRPRRVSFALHRRQPLRARSASASATASTASIARWSEPVSTREAVYANLGPGPYRFRVQARRAATGCGTARRRRSRSTIAPALWQTRWFRLAARAGALALVGWLVYAWRLRQATRRLNVRFEERLAERTRIAQELHDTLLQGFLSASMQLHVAVEQVPRRHAGPRRCSRACSSSWGR